MGIRHLAEKVREMHFLLLLLQRPTSSNLPPKDMSSIYNERGHVEKEERREEEKEKKRFLKLAQQQSRYLFLLLKGKLRFCCRFIPSIVLLCEKYIVLVLFFLQIQFSKTEKKKKPQIYGWIFFKTFSYAALF